MAEPKHQFTPVFRAEAVRLAQLRDCSRDEVAADLGLGFLDVLAGVAKYEREMVLDWLREGIADAKDEGTYQGRKPTSRTKAAEIQMLSAKTRPRSPRMLGPVSPQATGR